MANQKTFPTDWLEKLLILDEEEKYETLISSTKRKLSRLLERCQLQIVQNHTENLGNASSGASCL